MAATFAAPQARYRATKGNRTVIEEMKSAAQRRAVRDRADAEGLAKQLDDVKLTFLRKTASTTIFRVGDLFRHRRRTRGARVHHRPPQDPAGRFHQEPGRVHGAGELHRDVTGNVKVVVSREVE